MQVATLDEDDWRPPEIGAPHVQSWRWPLHLICVVALVAGGLALPRLHHRWEHHLPSERHHIEINLSIANITVLGEAQRWRRPSESGLLFNMRNSRAGPAMDTACATRLIPLPEPATVAYHITRLRPFTSLYNGSISIVHHMDLFACDKRMREPDDRECITDSWLGDHGPCYALLWAYDKGALAPHDLPADAGFLVGAGTPFTTLLLQVHYQLPRPLRASELREAGYHDTSGVVLTLASSNAKAGLRPHNAWSFEFMAYNMAIPAGATGVEYLNSLPAEQLAALVGDDLEAAQNGSLQLRQVHAHAHHHATRVALYRVRDGRRDVLLTVAPYCGYGECQHFYDLPDAPTIRRGDALEFVCTYDNPGREPLTYGLSAMQEMCGPIIVYTPHNPALRPHRWWYDSSEGQQRRGDGSGGDDRWVVAPSLQTSRDDFPLDRRM